jgi:hypothetical protein
MAAEHMMMSMPPKAATVLSIADLTNADWAPSPWTPITLLPPDESSSARASVSSAWPAIIDIRAALGKKLRRGKADAGAAAKHEGGLAFEFTVERGEARHCFT